MGTALGPHGPEQPLRVPVGVCSPPRGTLVLPVVAPLPAHSPTETDPASHCRPHLADGCWEHRGCPSACTQRLSRVVSEGPEKSPFPQLMHGHGHGRLLAPQRPWFAQGRPPRTSVLPQRKGLCWARAASGLRHALRFPAGRFAPNNGVPVQKNSVPPSGSGAGPSSGTPVLPCLGPAQHCPTAGGPLGFSWPWARTG